jgi:hypothetical protein
MNQISKAIVACSFVALAATSQAALKTKTKSNNCNERSTSCSEADTASEEISLFWGSDTPSDVHIISGTATPATGTEWSFGASNSSSAAAGGATSGGKLKYNGTHLTNVSRTKSDVDLGPGSMTLSFDGPAGGACPVTYDANNPIKGVGIVIKKNPGTSAERLSFSDVTVTQCDASGMTFSYAKGTKSWQLTR